MNRLTNVKISCEIWFKATELYMNLVGPECEEDILLRYFVGPSLPTHIQRDMLTV